MDYEKKYKEALERASKLRVQNPFDTVSQMMEYVFPQLAESDDERIRKALIKGVESCKASGWTTFGNNVDIDAVLSWLEKQGEQKHQYKSRPRYVGEEELLGVNKQGEQKPVDVKPHLPDGNIPYDRGFEEAQEYIFHRGFDIPWNDCDVFVDERYITQTVANVLTWADDHPKYGEQKPEMIQWTGNNLREVADFTGVHPMFSVWFKTWEDYETYVHNHDDIYKLFDGDGNHMEVPVGAWIMKAPDGYCVASKYRFVQKRVSDWSSKDQAHLESIDESLFMFESGRHENVVAGIEDDRNWLNSLKERVLPQQKPEWSEEDERNMNWVINVWNRLRRGGDAQTTPNQMEFLENWLKSLRTRKQWKPDVDELDALQDMLRYFRIESNAGNREQIADMVESLVEHLKVL